MKIFIFVRQGCCLCDSLKNKPTNFGDASKIPGVSKADLTALLVWLKIKELKKEKKTSFAEKKLSS